MDKNKKSKQFFDVQIKSWIPATLLYRVSAENAQQAADIIKYISPTSIKYNLNARRDQKLTVFIAGCSIIQFIKNFFS